MNLWQKIGVVLYTFRHSEEVSKKVRRYDFLRQSRSNLRIKKKKLEEQVNSLNSFRQRVPRIVRLLKDAKQTCLDVRTGGDVIRARVTANVSQNRALEEWRAPFEAEYVALQEENRMLRGGAYAMAVDAVIQTNSEARNIAFAYFDFVNRNFSYTPGTLKLLGVEGDIGKSSLKWLMGHINQNYRNEIFDSLRNGMRLRHYAAKTFDNSQDLYLSTYPVFYGEKGVGVGIFLEDQRNPFKRPDGTHSFKKGFKRAIKIMANYLDNIAVKPKTPAYT